MSERHWHRPAVFKGLRRSGGVTWYVYECECGQELPERKIRAPGITVPKEGA